MNKPFLSIVLPTRDRSDFVVQVLMFLQKQTFENFEVIISDNGINDLCLDKIKPFLADIRFKYKRPDRPMNMTDHWNFAIQEACGEYISIFNEKFFLRQDALQIIYNTYLEYKPDLISWNYEWLNDARFDDGQITGNYHPTTAPSETKRFSPSEYLQNHFDIKYPLSGDNSRDFLESRYGRIYGGCIRKQLVARVKKKFNQVFFFLSPDYTSQFLFLNETHSGIHISQSLMLHVVFEAVSNGMSTNSNFDKIKSFFSATGVDIENLKQQGPIFDFFLGSTYSVARDLHCLKKIVADGVIAKQQLNIPALCFYAKKELAVMAALDENIREEQVKLLDKVISNFTENEQEQYAAMAKLAQKKRESRWPGFLYASNFKHLAMQKSHQVLLDLSAKELASAHWCAKVMHPKHKSIFSNRVSLEHAVDYLYDYNRYSCQFLGIK